MRSAWFVASAIACAGCLAEESTTCPQEVLYETDDIAGSQLALVADRVAWTETNPHRVMLGLLDRSGSTATGQIGLYAFSRGMAVDGDTVYWTARLENMTDGALFATELSGITTMVTTFAGCNPSRLAIDGGAWWVGCGDTVHTETATYPTPGLLDVLPGYALTTDGIVDLVGGSMINVPALQPRRFARRGDTFYLVGNDQLFELAFDGSPPRELGRNMNGAAEIVVDDDAAYISTSMDDDPDLYRVPLDGDDPKTDPQIIATNSGGALAQNDTHVYWAVRGRMTPPGVWRVEKCR